MNRYRCLTLVAAVAVVLRLTAAHALINPHFTPVHLVEAAALIVWVDVEQGESKDQYTAVVREVVKGKTERKSFQFDLSKPRDARSADLLRDLAGEGKPALFFVGEFEDAVVGDRGVGSVGRSGALHISGRWAVFDGGRDGVWTLDQTDRALQAVWAGGTDMLRRAVDYILEDDYAVVPVADGVSWSAEPVKVATLDGAVNAVRPIDLAGDGELMLFVACDGGDRLLAYEGKKREFADVTAARGLQSKSRAFAWGDFAGWGRLDLVSFDGKAVTLHAQEADGTFQARPLDLGNVPENGCLGLAALDAGSKDRSGLLVATESSPMLVVFEAEGKSSSTALSAPGIGLTELGKPGPCLVADFDGDATADVLAPREAGSVLFRGLGPGKFAPGAACAVKLGEGPSAACLGDFDGDGRFDVLGVNAEGVYLWQNDGDGKFTETLDLSGELAYASRSGGIDCMTGDINNDGRQDALVAYGRSSPQVFFNRGFRSFGFAQTLNLGWPQLLRAAERGQQSACFGDFDGDGAQDMAMALPEGEIWIVYRENDGRNAGAVVAALPVDGRYKGPLAVTGWAGTHCLGAWNVLPGTGQTFFARRNPGPVTLKWRLPGGEGRQKEVVVLKNTVKVEIQ
jgi:hypothetical protein